MTVYGPATGHYSSQSIRAASRTGGKGGDRLVRNNQDGWDYVKDPTGTQQNPTQDKYGNYTVYANRGKSGSGSSASNPYDDMIAESKRAYAEILRKQEEAKQLVINKGVDTLTSQKSTLNQGFDTSAREAYIAKMQAEKALPEQLANQGITGGQSESSNLQLQTGYENNLNDINTNRVNALNGIDTSISELKNTGNAEIAELGAQNAQNALTAYQNLLQNKIAYEKEQQNQYKSDYTDSIGAYYGDYQARINELLSQGYAPDSFEVLKLKSAREQKIKDKDALDFENEYKLAELGLKTQQTNYDTSKPYYKPNSAKKNTGGLTTSLALSMYKAGIETEPVLRALGLD